MKKNKKELPVHKPGSTIFGGFKYGYPQKFLDELAEAMGIKLTRCPAQCVDARDIEIHPLSHPTGQVYYVDTSYNNQN